MDEGVAKDGSLLNGVNAVCSWDDGHMTNHHDNQELSTPRQLESVKVQLNKEALSLLPLAIRYVFNDHTHLSALHILTTPPTCRGRVRHGRHFTYKSYTEDLAVTLVGRGVEGAFACDSRPLAAHGHWLQVYLSEDHLQQLEKGVAKLQDKVSTTNRLAAMYTVCMCTNLCMT